MRIWIINHYALSPIRAGGTRHYNFAKQLIERGHEVIIIAANYDHFSHSYIHSPVKPGEIDHSYSVPFIWIPTPKYYGNTIARFWNMLVFSWNVLKKKYLTKIAPPDIIIGSSPHLFSAMSAEILSRRFNVPFVLEIRDIWPDTLVDLGRISNHHPMIRIMKKIELYLYKRAKRIICLLPSADKYLIENGVAARNILWLPNAIDAMHSYTSQSSATKNPFTVMYAGAHGLANDLDTVVDAAKILQEKPLHDVIRICLVGDGPDKKRLKERVLNENIKMIEFIDSVPKKEVYSTLNNADVFLMLLKKSPIFRFGISPNKLFDYLLMSRPVIFGVDTPFNPIAKYNAGISITPSDPNSLASAIEQLYHTPKAERDDMGIRGREFVLQNHDITRLTTALEELLLAI